jgi:hypothetical protein
MKKIIIPLFALFSCSNSDKILIAQKNDYVSYQGSKYIQTHVSTNVKVINPDSSIRFVINNKEKDTIYIFSTVINNENMFYSKKNIEVHKGTVFINSYYKEFSKDAIYSGIRKFNFIELLPMDSLMINIDETKVTQISKSKAEKIRFTYYFFKKGRDFSRDGLLNVNKAVVREKSIYWLYRFN